MNALCLRMTLVSLLFCGCINPFGSKPEFGFIGVWGPEDGSATLKSIAFLDKGRYYENNAHAGAYYVLSATPGASGIEGTSFFMHRVRIDYINGERIEISVWTFTHTGVEIRIFGASGRGPGGNYHKLHTGDGL